MLDETFWAYVMIAKRIKLEHKLKKRTLREQLAMLDGFNLLSNEELDEIVEEVSSYLSVSRYLNVRRARASIALSKWMCRSPGRPSRY